MKRLAFLICLMLSNYILLAQNTNASKPDSTTQAAAPVQQTLKKVDGATMMSTNDIVVNISKSPDLSMFYKIIQTAGLTETFNSKGPITVFAPNNQAFANMSKGKLDSLLKSDRKYDLIAMLTYHALPGIVKAKDIAHAINAGKGTATLITLTGSKLFAKLDANRNIILVDENGGECVISKFNIDQSNGLIHLVNAVLVPRFKNI